MIPSPIGENGNAKMISCNLRSPLKKLPRLLRNVKRVQCLVSTNPVLKVRELSSSSAASKPAPESAAAAPSGGHERAPANRSPATATEAHAATSAPETPASTIVTQRNPERLGVHPPLLRPGLPPFPERKNTSESKSTACRSLLLLCKIQSQKSTFVPVYSGTCSCDINLGVSYIWSLIKTQLAFMQWKVSLYECVTTFFIC